MRQIISIVAFAFVAFTASCGGSAGGDPTMMMTRSLSSPDAAKATGKVLDANGTPIQGVRVIATTTVDTLEDQPFVQRTATTDASGAYTLDGLLCRTYTVEFEAPQYFKRTISKSPPQEAKGKTSLWGELALLPVPTPGYFMTTEETLRAFLEVTSGQFTDSRMSQALNLTNCPLPQRPLDKDEQGALTVVTLSQSLKDKDFPRCSSPSDIIIKIGSKADDLAACPLQQVIADEQMSVFVYQKLLSQTQSFTSTSLSVHGVEGCRITAGSPLFFAKDGKALRLTGGVYAICSAELSLQHTACFIRVGE